MLALFAALGHVPTYGSADQKCIQPPHVHTTSQAVYLKGSGGLELHTKSDTDPIDTTRGDVLLDFDSVFREKYPKDSFHLYVGCGGKPCHTHAADCASVAYSTLESRAEGCVEGVDPIVIPPLDLDPWSEGIIEPFTQV